MTVARSRDEVERLRGEWAKLCSHCGALNPNADIDHFLCVTEHLESAVRPHVILLSEGGEPVAALMCRVDKGKLVCSFGYGRLLSFPVRRLSVIHAGALVTRADTQVPVLLRELAKALREEDVNLVYFNMVPRSLDFHKVLMRSSSSSYRWYQADRNPLRARHWRLQVPASLKDFLDSMSSGHRSNLRNYSNRIERGVIGRAHVRCFRSVEDVEALLEATESVASRTYQRGLGVGVKKDQATRSRMHLAAEKGWLRSYVLYLDDEPRAFQLGFQYAGGYHVMGKGFEAGYRKHRIGTYLFMRMLKEFADERVIKYWDYGIGDAEYKELYGSESWEEESFHLFSPSIRGLLMSVSWSITTHGTDMVKWATGRWGLTGMVKRAWRQRVTPRS